MTERDWIWISWERHRRTENLVRAMDIDASIYDLQLPRWRKHPALILRTTMLLARRRPEVLIVQNPSWVLTTLAIFLKKLLGYRLIVDAHNAGVYPFEAAHEKFRSVFPFFHRHADLTVVTNSDCATIVERNGGCPFILPDILPEFKEVLGTARAASEEAIVTFICTYASDEPYVEVIAAARDIAPGIGIRITGNASRCPDDIRRSAPANVRFTGFLPENDYVAQLVGSDVIMDLTTFEDCLVCGAYEAVALGIPLILSDTTVNRTYFNKGVVYTKNDRKSLVLAINEAVAERENLYREVQQLRGELQMSSKLRLDDLIAAVEGAKL